MGCGALGGDGERGGVELIEAGEDTPGRVDAVQLHQAVVVAEGEETPAVFDDGPILGRSTVGFRFVFLKEEEAGFAVHLRAGAWQRHAKSDGDAREDNGAQVYSMLTAPAVWQMGDSARMGTFGARRSTPQEARPPAWRRWREGDRG